MPPSSGIVTRDPDVDVGNPSISEELRGKLPPEVRRYLESLEASERALRHEVDRLSIFRHLAYRDDLTGLYNRRHFGERLAQEWSRAARFGDRLALLVIDLDGFKLVNDLAGHAVGDQVLAQVGRWMLDECRRFDIPCRLGGDEFAILLPETDTVGALALHERLAARFALGEGLPPLPQGSRLGLSVGIAERAEAGSAAELVARADAAMYAQKRRRKAEPGSPQGTCAA